MDGAVHGGDGRARQRTGPGPAVRVFDLTAVCSYLLIGFDRQRREARTAALMALLVTVVSAVLMLVAAVMLYTMYGTFSIPELLTVAPPGTTTTSLPRS